MNKYPIYVRIKPSCGDGVWKLYREYESEKKRDQRLSQLRRAATKCLEYKESDL